MPKYLVVKIHQNIIIGDIDGHDERLEISRPLPVKLDFELAIFASPLVGLFPLGFLFANNLIRLGAKNSSYFSFESVSESNSVSIPRPRVIFLSLW